MKRVSYFLGVLMLLTSCGRTGSKSGANTVNDESVEIDLEDGNLEEFNPHSFLLTEKKLPNTVNLQTDISDMTYQELLLLKNYVYATHGLWFLDEEQNRFFTNKCDWYYDTCYAYLEKHDWNALTEYDKTDLTSDEKAFVDKINKRMAAMEQQRTVNRNGTELLNPALTVNMFQLDDFNQDFYTKLAYYNYGITPTDKQQLFNIYEMNDYLCVPNYMTTDVYLQAFHMYFSFVLKCLERHEFTDRLHKVCQMMNQRALQFASQTDDSQLKDMAEYNAAFFAIADRLLVGEEMLTVPTGYRTRVDEELLNINAEKPALSPMMSYRDVLFTYDMFRPRGHYTRSEKEQRYFRAMMWLQTCTFCRENTTSLKYASMMAYIINSYRKEKKSIGESIYETLNFLIGEPDNVSVFDMADFIEKGNFATMTDLIDENKLQWLDGMLRNLFKSRNRITPKVADGDCVDKINYMPQRYTPDGEMLSRMFDETPNAEHPFPTGLDIFSAFGSAEADYIINKVYDYPSKWKEYSNEAARMKEKFGKYEDWDKSMYNKWMECLVELQNTDKNHPDYMQTSAWRRKNLHTALASWAELKHDAILYGEQPLAAECGSGSDFPDPVLVGYVEPNIRFWNKMRELLTLTRNLLEKHGLMDQRLSNTTEQLESYIDFCIRISNKELAGKPLEETEYREIRYLGSSLEWFTLSVIDPDLMLDHWSLVQGPDRSVAIVADVFTRNVPNCDKCGILYEATGNADAIYVLVDIGGKTYLTRGATFSYYEFVNPLGQRLTDEEWQQRLEEGKEPERPKWMQPFMINQKPTVNEMVFYSTGC